jgi:RimJ/RimL family protein N-acetyltransferase
MKTWNKREEWTDKDGLTFTLGRAFIEDRPRIEEMYDGPHGNTSFQGLPPPGPEARSAWIAHLVEGAITICAWLEGKVVGHASLFVDREERDAEFLLFVAQPFRNRGLGTRLTMMALDCARELSLKQVWLTVEVYNFRAASVFEKCGFVVSDRSGGERTMIVKL